MSRQFDVVIIGGGVTGSASAFFLAAEPAFDGTVLVVERDPTYEHAPSARSTGGFRQQFSTPENIRMGLFGAHFVKNIDAYLSVDDEAPQVGFVEAGYLLLASAAMRTVMRENHAMQRAHGADIGWQSPPELARRFPWLDTRHIAGGCLGASNEGWIDPYALLQAYRRKARALGVTYASDEVVRLTRSGNRVTRVDLRDMGQIQAGTVIDAAGARDAASLAAMVDIALPVEPRKRCTFVIDCREEIGTTPLTILPQGVAFRPEGRHFICNAAPPPHQDPATCDLDIDYDLFDERIWPALAEHVPAFEAIKLVRAWPCHYDFNTLDENAIIGRASGIDNFYVAVGFSGHGLQQSPAVGRALSELITFGEFRTLDLARFGYERVLNGQAIRETNCY